MVLVYAKAIGLLNGKLKQHSYLRRIKAEELFPATAIQTTTAAGMAAVVELWLRGDLRPGFVRQEDISFQRFLGTRWGRAIYGGDTVP